MMDNSETIHVQYYWSFFFLGAEYLHPPASSEYPKQHCEEAKAEMQ